MSHSCQSQTGLCLVPSNYDKKSSEIMIPKSWSMGLAIHKSRILRERNEEMPHPRVLLLYCTKADLGSADHLSGAWIKLNS